MEGRTSIPQWTPPPGWVYQPAAPAPRNGLGIAALVLGICGVLVGFVPILFAGAIICGVVGVILGLIGWSRTRKGTANNPKMTIIGTAACAVAIALGIWGIVTVVGATNQFVSDVNNIGVPGASSAPVAPSASVPSAAGSPIVEPGAGPTLFLGQQPGDVVGQRGETLTLGTMQLKAEKLRQISSQYGPAVKCSQVTYTNTGTAQESFSSFDWKLQKPAGSTLNSTFTTAGKPLNSGQLAPGGTTTGDVCFDTTEPMAGWVLLNAPGFSFDAPRAAFLG